MGAGCHYLHGPRGVMEKPRKKSPSPAPNSQFLRNLAKSLDRLQVGLHAVGKGDQDQLDWLQELEGRDLSSDADQQRAADEIHAFCFANPAFWRGSAAFVNPEVERVIETSLAAQDVRKAQTALQRCLQSLRRERHFRFPDAVINAVVWVPGKGIYGVTYGGGSAQFLAAVWHLLTRVGSRLKVCEAAKCGRFFEAARPKQKYCTPGCQNREAQARFRATHATEIPERRHEDYERKRRRQHGPKVKVGRRPRRRTDNPPRRKEGIDGQTGSE